MAHKKVKAFIMILDKKEAWFYSSSQLKNGSSDFSWRECIQFWVQTLINKICYNRLACLRKMSEHFRESAQFYLVT